MGANIPPLFSSPTPVQKRKPGIFFVLAGSLVLIFCALKWHDVIEYVDGEPKLTSKHQQELQKKVNELEQAEQYALVATKERLYPCLHSGHVINFDKN